MKRMLLASTAAIGLATGAQAADLLPPYEAPAMVAPVAAPSWTGFYFGGHLGAAFDGDEGAGILFDSDGDGDFDDTILTGGGIDAFGDNFSSSSDAGADVGARIGYDWQMGNLVLGAVADVSYTDFSDSASGFSSTPAFYTFDRELDWLATGRLRAGYAFGDVLIYATGGVAIGDVQQSFSSDTPATITGEFGGDDTSTGYTVGGGVETFITPQWTLGVEYLYTNLGDDEYGVTLAGPGAPGGPFGAGTDLIRSDDDFDFHTVRATLSYRWSGL